MNTSGPVARRLLRHAPAVRGFIGLGAAIGWSRRCRPEKVNAMLWSWRLHRRINLCEADRPGD
jgi:hypothetical protein